MENDYFLRLFNNNKKKTLIYAHSASARLIIVAFNIWIMYCDFTWVQWQHQQFFWKGAYCMEGGKNPKKSQKSLILPIFYLTGRKVGEKPLIGVGTNASHAPQCKYPLIQNRTSKPFTQHITQCFIIFYHLRHSVHTIYYHDHLPRCYIINHIEKCHMVDTLY